MNQVPDKMISNTFNSTSAASAVNSAGIVETLLPKTLYSTGYLLDGAGQQMKGRSTASKTRAFDALVDRLNLLVCDIRLVPYPKAPAWRADGPSGLIARLGDLTQQSDGKYLSIPALGNMNYKRRGDAPIRISKPELGVAAVVAACRRSGRQPLLLCGCEDVTCCHRSVVARLMLEYYNCTFQHWIEITHWMHPAEVGRYGLLFGTDRTNDEEDVS